MSNIQQHETIWFPGIYGGRTDEEYTQPITGLTDEQIIEFVQRRAQEDGEWAIENGFVGDNEDKMRKMMEWVSREDNIRQCVQSYRDEAKVLGINDDYEPRTVDYICRDLANGSKWVSH